MIIEKQKSNKLKEYSNHLKRLSQQDRYTRFGSSIRNDGIDNFILSILYNLEKHHIFAAIEADNILGYVHLAQIKDSAWELAISVDGEYQGRGVGNKLMTYAISWAKTQGIESMFMHCITDNKKIQHLASKHGLKTIERDGADITSMVKLPASSKLDNLKLFFNNRPQIVRKIMSLQTKFLYNITLIK